MGAMNGKSLVTWGQLAPTLASMAMLALVSFNLFWSGAWGAHSESDRSKWAEHTSRIHDGAVDRKMMEAFFDERNHRIDALIASQVEIKEELKELRKMLFREKSTYNKTPYEE